MATSVVITNLTDAPVYLADLYATLDPSGVPTDTITITRAMADLDRMPSLQALVTAATVSVVVSEVAGNVQAMSVPCTQYATVTGLAVGAVAVVTHAVTFATPFPTGVTPVITFGLQRTTTTDWKAQVYADAVTNTGFTIALDVTTASATGGATGNVNWVAKY